MPSPEDLRRTLNELANSARDVPDMPLTRAGRLHRASATKPVLLAAGLLVVVLAIGLGTSRQDLLPFTPAGGPTRAVPSAATPSSSMATTARSTLATSATARTPGLGAEATTRPMTPTEITTQTSQCLKPADGPKKFRRGELKVRYAMVQAAVGYPRDSLPRTALLLEDASGYYDCSGDYGTYTSKVGDDPNVDHSAAGVDLPTLSGGSTGRCKPPRKAATIDSAVVLKTSTKAHAARVAVRAAGGTRTATLLTGNGYLYVATQVSGEAAWKSSKFTVELLDASGKMLPVQPYTEPVTNRLTYALPACTRTDR